MLLKYFIHVCASQLQGNPINTNMKISIVSHVLEKPASALSVLASVSGYRPEGNSDIGFFPYFSIKHMIE